MSLINEALKKAQKLRTGDLSAALPPMPGGDTRVTKRAQPRSTQQLLVLASGGLVLVVLSVVITFWLVNRAPAEKPVAKLVAPKSASTEPAVAPVIVPPVIKPVAINVETPKVKSNPPPAPTEKSTPVTKAVAEPPATSKAAPVVTTPAPAPIQSPPVTAPAPTRADPVAVAPETLPQAQAVQSPPSTQTPPPTTPESVATGSAPAPAPAAPEPAAPVKTDERVHQFVDAIKVGGIRSSGGDSRVLMNDRVFRVNEIVERNFGLRLTKVEPDALTFTDGNGAVYVKHF